MTETGRWLFRQVFLLSYPIVRLYRGALQSPASASHLYVLLHAQLGQSLLNSQGCQSGCSVRVPALSHDLPHHPQRLHTHTETNTEDESPSHTYTFTF